VSLIRVKFNVNVGPYVAGYIYDVEDVPEIHLLVANKLADIVPFPQRVLFQELTLF